MLLSIERDEETSVPAEWAGDEQSLLMLGQGCERYYDPFVGRFISEDPVRHAAGDNLQQYGGNNPINEMDPSGQATQIYPENKSFPATGTVSSDGKSFIPKNPLVINGETVTEIPLETVRPAFPVPATMAR